MLHALLERHPRQSGRQVPHVALRGESDAQDQSPSVDVVAAHLRVQPRPADRRPGEGQGQAAGQAVREEGIQDAVHAGDNRLPQSDERAQKKHGELCVCVVFMFENISN